MDLSENRLPLNPLVNQRFSYDHSHVGDVHHVQTHSYHGISVLYLKLV